VPVLAEYRDGMTRCTEEGWKAQEKCVYAKKSAFAERCQFFVQDKWCDNLYLAD
jgi:hypothetical protein